MRCHDGREGSHTLYNYDEMHLWMASAATGQRRETTVTEGTVPASWYNCDGERRYWTANAGPTWGTANAGSTCGVEARPPQRRRAPLTRGRPNQRTTVSGRVVSRSGAGVPITYHLSPCTADGSIDQACSMRCAADSPPSPLLAIPC